MVVQIQEHEPLAKHTSWRIGGPARYYAEASAVEQLREALGWARERGLPIFLLGGGSNLLVRDTGFDGLVLRYRAQGWRIEERGNNQGTLYAEAGAPMAGTVRRVCAQGWGGLEWAEGLPGTIGGAVRGNAGCYGGDIAGVLERAWLLSGHAEDGHAGFAIEEWPQERLEYGYRSSALKTATSPSTQHSALSTPPIVLGAELRVRRADPAELAAAMARIAGERRGKTPWGSSCGSVFKNPPGQSAGRLIELAGLKGSRSGAAQISERHANYIVNTGGAGSDDVLRLIDLARREVLRQFGVQLELEVVVL
jgi:UDP-N-acetylmuramate dehydrogenase